MIKLAYEDPNQGRATAITREIVRTLKLIWPELPDNCLAVHADNAGGEPDFGISFKEGINWQATFLINYVMHDWVSADQTAASTYMLLDSRFDRLEKYVLDSIEYPFEEGRTRRFASEAVEYHRLVSEAEEKIRQSARKNFPEDEITDEPIFVCMEGVITLNTAGLGKAGGFVNAVLTRLPTDIRINDLHGFIVGDRKSPSLFETGFAEAVAGGIEISDEWLGELQANLLRIANRIFAGAALRNDDISVNNSSFGILISFSEKAAGLATSLGFLASDYPELRESFIPGSHVTLKADPRAWEKLSEMISSGELEAGWRDYYDKMRGKGGPE